MVRKKQDFKPATTSKAVSQPISTPKFEEVCCNENCKEKFSSKELKQIESNFVGMKFEARNAFIRASVNVSEEKRTYTIFSKKTCCKFFQNSLKISSKAISNAMSKWESDTTKDLRGSHGNHSILSGVKRTAVIEHIRKFPVYKSHYKRETSSSLYLESNLTVSLMYRLFEAEWYENHEKNSNESDDKPPSYTFYLEIFTSLGLKFKPLKSDTCKMCDLLRVKINATSSDDLKRKLSEELEIHQALGERLQNEMKRDIELAKTDSSIQVMVYDLQKVLIIPKAPSSMLYYTRNFNIYNLNIHENGNGNFYVWTEVDASRGSREIASCIIKHLNENLKEDTAETILWSDSCSGQNRNHIVACILLHFLHTSSSKYPNLKKITLKFLKSGHTYNICDTDFGTLEKAIRRQQIICTLQQYLDIMQKCKLKNPFKVIEMQKNDFIGTVGILRNITKRDVDKYSKENVSWLKTHELQLLSTHPFSLFLKYPSADEFKELNYQKLKRKASVGSVPWNQVQYEILYPDGRQLTAAKKKDLLKIASLLPVEGQEFIKKITQSEGVEYEDDIDGFAALDFEILNENEY